MTLWRAVACLAVVFAMALLSGCASVSPSVKAVCSVCATVCPLVGGLRTFPALVCPDREVAVIANWKEVEKGAAPKLVCK